MSLASGESAAPWAVSLAGEQSENEKGEVESSIELEFASLSTITSSKTVREVDQYQRQPWI